MGTARQLGCKDLRRALGALPPRVAEQCALRKVQWRVASRSVWLLRSKFRALIQFCSRLLDAAHPREVVLGKVDALVKDFVYRASLAHGLSEGIARSSGGKIFTFGSYRLGVHGPGADIDTLCVVPKHIHREDFFTIFEDMLKKREEITEITSVSEAYVPIIKTKFMGLSIDLLFARLALPKIDDTLELKDDNLLKNLDERCIRSLGGTLSIMVSAYSKRTILTRGLG